MWAGSFAVRTGNVAVGVRVDDATLLAVLRHAYAPHLMEVADPPPYLSVQRNPDEGVGLLYEGTCRVQRTRDAVRLAHGVDARLAALSGVPPAAGRVRVAGVAIVTGDAAVLLPPSRRQEVDEARTALAREGATPVDGPECEIDVDTAEVIVSPGLADGHLDAALEAHDIAAQPANGDRGGARGGVEPPPPHGRYPLRAILDGEDESASSRAARLIGQITAVGEGSRLTAAVRLVQQIPCGPPPSGDPRTLVEAVRLASAHSASSRSPRM